MSQRVVFRKWKDTGDVIALFLDQPERAGLCMAYEHVGQHGAGSYPHPDTLPASAEEYAPLLCELQSIGYDDLRVVRRGRIAADGSPRPFRSPERNLSHISTTAPGRR